jgi:hypothetical protein
MAIVTMTELALEAERPKVVRGAEAGLEGVSEPAAQTGKRTVSALDQIVAYVPTEVIRIYIAGVGIVGPAGRAKWGLLLLSTALIPLFVWLSDRIARQSDPSVPKAYSKLAWVCLLAACAFLAWAAALPETPFLDFSEKATRLGSFAAVVLAAIIPKVAAAVGIAARP